MNTGKNYLSKDLIQIMLPDVLIFVFINVVILCVLIKISKSIARETKRNHAKLRELEHVNQILEETNDRIYQELSEYEGNLYHQMKTPLACLQMSLEQCDETDAVQSANAQVGKLSRFITLLLREQQLNTGKIKYHYDTYSLNDLLEDVISELAPISNEKAIRLELAFDEDESLMACDELWLSQCFLTLMENCIEHSIENQVIQVQIQKDNADYHVSMLSPGSCIEKEALPHLFERFYSQSTSNHHFGIGLHLAKTIVEQHHGRIFIKNKLNQGVAIDIYLPILIGSKGYDVMGL